ncbi:hypothetical protein FRC00_001959 [Tulasnella sp. 408]|nr:hypothetical protein FRC00_001959 [Tulasnella sp. 408]
MGLQGSALLWTDISAQSGKTYIRRVLELSKPSAIDLDYPAYTKAQTNLEKFIAVAGPHIARWRSLTIAVKFHPQSWEKALAPLITVQAPILESLELCWVGTSNAALPNPITLFGGASAPSTFKRLTLHGVQVAVETLNLSGLISLKLGRVANISTLQLLDIIRNSPWLETLSLWEVTSIGSQSSAIPPIELPKLDSLTLYLLDAGGENFILSTIRIPNRGRLYICNDLQGDNVQSTLFTPTIAHILHTTSFTADPKSPDIEVEVRDGDFCFIRFREMELELYMNVEDQMQGILGWLAEMLGSEAAGCSVRLMIDPSDVDVDVDLDRLIAVPSPLFFKELSAPGQLFGLFLQAFCDTTLQPAEPGSSNWPLLQMESLTIDFDTTESQEEFISMLRSCHGEPSDEAESRWQAMNLKSVELRGGPIIEGLVEEITRILGEVNVFWRD